MARSFLSQDLPAQVANNSHRDTPRRAAAVLAAWLLAVLVPTAPLQAQPAIAASPTDLHEIAPLDLKRTTATPAPPAPLNPEPRPLSPSPAAAQLADSAAPAARQQTRLTLAECRAQALAHNLDLRVQLVEPLTAAERVTEAEARFEASFVADASYTGTDTPGLDGYDSQAEDTQTRAGFELPLKTGGTVTAQLRDERVKSTDLTSDRDTYYSPGFTISVSQPLLRSAGRRVNTHAIRIAGVERRIAEARTRLEVIRVLTAVDRVYWRLYAARRELEVRKMEQALARAQLENARRLVASGEKPQIEVIRAESAVADREEAILIANKEIRDRERELNRVVRGSAFANQATEEIVPATEPDPVHYALSAPRLVLTALQSRMELLEIELTIASDKDTVEYLRNDALPLVNLEYSYNVNAIGGTRGDAYDLLNDKDYEDHRLGLVVRIPLGNQAARSRLRQALYRRQQDLASQENRQLLIETEVLAAVDQQQVAWQRILASRQRALLSGRLLEAEQHQFEVGVGTSTDLLDAQAKLADAQSAEIRALVEYEISLVDLSYATGLVLGADKVRWEPHAPDGPAGK
ncbi:MAG: hypothetical protein A3K19_13995 [Lentisphaerae bacterium RIFOXYB12_FULL_65_16]|nr:MAG: hypothetical protein A3K18_25995 [Lentisphaerae bacterium RIFOXYA12_64_32]OGV88226.1 MAG: hypothetical protein A3K19_13995 [Lentisphaerae bacterium RIFOXYB12_FULL_65_16]